MQQVETLVLGAGPTGLAVAYGLQGDTLVLEKEAVVGGLCRSIRRGCAVFDLGGHSFHTPHPQVRRLVRRLLEEPLYAQPREARVYTHGQLIPYPFQTFFDRIPDAQVVRECREGLNAARGDPAGAPNLEEHLVRRFGAGIAEHFLLPYNRKLWARDLATITPEWTGERVAAPTGESGTPAPSAGRRRPLRAGSRVGYPRRGGYEEIFRAFVDHLPALTLGQEVVAVDSEMRVAVTGDGRRVAYRRLVSTIPLPELVRLMEGVPEEVRAGAARLEAVSLRVLLLLTARPLATPIQRIYVADPQVPPHKIALNANSSAYLRSQPQHAITAEVSVSPPKPVDLDRAPAATVAFLVEAGVLDSPADVVWQGHVDLPYGYPVYTPDRRALVERVKVWMAGRGIYSVGRFGDWAYVNADECVRRGLALARQLRRA